MNNISQELIDQYKEVHFKLYKKELDNQEAYESLFNLTGFFKVLEKIDKRVKLEKELLEKYKEIEEPKEIIEEKPKNQ